MALQHRKAPVQVGEQRQEVPRHGHQLWITTRQLAETQGWTMRAAYCWIHRHRIVRRNDGRVSRRDVQRELDRPSLRGRSVGTLTNLRAMAARRRVRR